LERDSASDPLRCAVVLMTDGEAKPITRSRSSSVRPGRQMRVDRKVARPDPHALDDVGLDEAVWCPAHRRFPACRP
jgi:hypothetical protein